MATSKRRVLVVVNAGGLAALHDQLALGGADWIIGGPAQLEPPKPEVPDLWMLEPPTPPSGKKPKKKRGSAGCSHKSRRCTGSLRPCFTCEQKKHKKVFVCAEHQCRICKKCPQHCLRRDFNPPHDFEAS